MGKNYPDSELMLNKAANMVRAFKISRIQVSDLEVKTVADPIQKSKVQSNSHQGQHSSQRKKIKKMLLLWNNTQKTGLSSIWKKMARM